MHWVHSFSCHDETCHNRKMRTPLWIHSNLSQKSSWAGKSKKTDKADMILTIFSISFSCPTDHFQNVIKYFAYMAHGHVISMRLYYIIAYIKLIPICSIISEQQLHDKRSRITFGWYVWGFFFFFSLILPTFGDAWIGVDYKN